MDANVMKENNHEQQTSMEVVPQNIFIEEEVNIDLLNAIKEFVDDLSSVNDNKNFKDYRTIVNHIDHTKVKSYNKLIKGFKNFYDINSANLTKGNFKELIEPNISFVTDNGSFNFNFQKVFDEAEEDDQDTIKDHLNHIWNLLNDTNKGPEELYINKIFKDLKSKFSPDMTRDEQMTIAKDLFSDFQKQNLDISIVVKVACKKARELLLSNGSEDHSKTLILIDAVEEIDINNFNMVQFMALVAKVGTLFADGENNPLSDILSNVFTHHNLPIENLDNEESDH
jgi:hypothetical protein